MKIFPILFFLILCGFLNAQVIEFTDLYFKNALLSQNVYDSDNDGYRDSTADLNQNGEIEVNEAESIDNLYIWNANNITNPVALSYFSNLKLLGMRQSQIPNLDLTGLTQLENISFSYNFFENLNITGLPLQSIVLINCNISSLNVAQFPNLAHLEVPQNSLSTIDLSNNPLLTVVKLGYNSLSTIDVSNSPLLTDVQLEVNNLSSVEFSNNSSIESLNLFGNPINEIDVTGMPNLRELIVRACDLNSLDISANPILEKLFASQNNLSTIETENQIYLNLRRLGIGENQFQEIDLTIFPQVDHLDISENNFSEIDLSPLNLLSTLKISNNPISELDILDNENFYSLEASNTLLQEIDLSAGNSFYLTANDNPNLEYVSIKDGKIMGGYETYSFMNCPNLSFICIDENEFGTFPNQGNNYFNFALDEDSDVVVNSYCSFVPGGNYQTIQGMTKYDLEGNGCDQGTTIPLENISYTVADSSGIYGTVLGNSEGYFAVHTYLEEGAVTITPTIENPNIFAFEPSNAIIPFPNSEEEIEQNFCVSAIGTSNDVEIVLIPIGDARPGFEADYILFYKNKGNTTLNGTIEMVFPNSYTSLVESLPDVASETNDTFTWNYQNLLPFESREIALRLLLNTPTHSEFPLNGGDELDFELSINPISGDLHPRDNQFNYTQTVVNSYDPNDKRCLEGESLNPEMVGEYVHYMIRFENTGSASALNIVVKDELDTESFDLSTIIPIKGSHPFETRIRGNIVEFIFENINLPFDDENNDGYVIFKIKTWDTLEVNDTFSNQAEIYFDYNAPIITNDFETTVQILEMEDIDFQQSSIIISPNPIENTFQIRIDAEIQKIEIYSLDGKLFATFLGTQKEYSIAHLPAGVYLLQVHTDQGKESTKLIKE